MRKDSSGLNPFSSSVQDRKLFMVIAGTVAVVVVVVSLGFYQSSRDAVAARQTIIQVTANGFIPATVSVKAGSQIVWKNTDSAPHTVSGNPYVEKPTTDLRSNTILPNGSYTYKATSAGEIQYHDRTQPTLGGSIKVEK
jgi:plastocyanin